jgi:hypothetical protein
MPGCVSLAAGNPTTRIFWGEDAFHAVKTVIKYIYTGRRRLKNLQATFKA